jgi:DNA-directed RNA polymerase subunit A"
MVIYLKERISKSREKARDFARQIEMATVEDLVSQVEMDLINTAFVMTLSRQRLQQKNLTPSVIAAKIKEELNTEVSMEGYKLCLKPKELTLSGLRKISLKVKKIPLHGIKGINRVVVKLEDNEYVVYTEGSNLAEVLKLPEVDANRTTTNDIHEINNVLGIEATRSAIINELLKTLGEQGLEVDVRHLMMVADMMTDSGELRQIGRHGVSGKKSSILARASFEITTKHLLDACIRGERDNLNGIIENVITGQAIPLGTGMVELTRQEGKTLGSKQGNTSSG